MTPATTLTAFKNAPKAAIAWLNGKPKSQYTYTLLGDENSTTQLNRAGRFTERVATFGGLAALAVVFLSNPMTSVFLAALELMIVAMPVKLAGYFTGLAVDAAIHATDGALTPANKTPWFTRWRKPMRHVEPEEALERFIDDLNPGQRRTLMTALERKASQDFAAASIAANEESFQPPAAASKKALSL